MTEVLAVWAQRFFELGALGCRLRAEPEPARELVGDSEPEPDLEPEPAPARPTPAPAPCTPALVFDTETCGSKGAQLAVQIAWIVYDGAGAEVRARCEYLALPPGRTINYFAQRVHGISDAIVRERGMAPQFVLADFFDAVERVTADGGHVVAHNARFDAQVVTNTAESCGLARDLRAEDCLCTMERSKHWLKLVNKRGGLKAPKNAELYAHLVGIELDQSTLHNALNDVRVTGASFFAGRKKGWW